MSNFTSLLSDLRTRAGEYGVTIRSRKLGPERPAVFDGPTITLDPGYELEGRCFYLAHALGSITQWSTDFERASRTRDELRDAKKRRDQVPERFHEALRNYLAFEERSSDHAVWLLANLDDDWAIEPYTVFFRADLEAMAQFHTRGVAPVWQEFFPEWKRRAAAGALEIRPFQPRPIPDFKPVKIPKQEVVREEDGES